MPPGCHHIEGDTVDESQRIERIQNAQIAKGNRAPWLTIQPIKPTYPFSRDLT